MDVTAAVFGQSMLGVFLLGSGGGLPFENVVIEVGLAGYVASTGDGHGPGGVFADLNHDGYPDLYLMRAWDDPSNQLYVNVEGDGGSRQFMQAPNNGGAGDTGNATGAIAGDYDNDGDLDLYVLNFDQPNALYQNQWAQTGQLNFVNVTALTDPTPGENDDQFGVGIAFFDGVGLDNSLTAAWADVDRDGNLDLYVGNHNGWFNNPIEGPFPVPGRRDILYLNNGDGTFTDVTMKYNVTGYMTADGEYETPNQRFSSTNAVIFADFNNDRWPDLLVTNKVGGPDDRDMLYINLGADEKGTWLGFEMVTYDLVPTFGHLSGAAMGVDVVDFDNDGDLDIYITDWSDPDNPNAPGTNDLWVNGLSQFGELSFFHTGVVPAKFSWGTQWQDFDHNGLADLHVATNGPFRDYLYLNVGKGFIEVAEKAGVAQFRNARGDMTADYDRDGWVDLFVVNLDGGLSALFRNNLVSIFPEQHFLAVELRGDASRPGPLRSTLDAIGARAVVRADLDGDGSLAPYEVQMREVVSGSSNAGSTSSLGLEFGLGAATSAMLDIHWPSGEESSFIVAADQFVSIDEGDIVLGDLDADGTVGAVDLLILLALWGPCDDCDHCPADLNGDCSVGATDLLILLANWG